MSRNLELVQLGLDACILDAMESLDRSGFEIVFLRDVDGRIVGVATDGDIRRALLRGAALRDPLRPHMQKGFTSVTRLAGRAEVLDLMRARGLEQIPILDERGHLEGLHLLREVVGGRQRENWAVVMAGGRGQRLRPLTDSIPKPMVRVAGRPVLERVVLHLVSHGIRTVFLAIHYLGAVIQEHFGDGRQFGCRIHYLIEDKPLGSGGALSLLPERPSHPLLVLNGDLLTEADLGRMLEFFERGGFAAAVGVHTYTHGVPYGVVEADEDCLVKGLREKPVLSWQVNAGIYVLAPHLIERVPSQTVYPLPSILEECLERGEKVGAFPIETEWVDIGRPQELMAARGQK